MDTGEIRSLLADRPDLEEPLDAVREVDHEMETWTFDDIPIDSGAFGELVGEGVVESVGDEYRLADPTAVDRVLDGEEIDSSEPALDVEFSLPDVDPTAAKALVALLVVVVVFRASTYSSVIRDRVVYTGNDPYFYVFAVERGLTEGWSLSALPAGRSSQEPLTTAGMLFSAELAGGLGSHGPILAWLPVFVAVATAVVLYFFAREVTDDRRVGLAAVLCLAVVPVHVTRSALGFPDHHVFDYFWLVVAAWGLAATLDLEEFTPEWPTVRAVGLLAAGVAGQVLAWWAGTLLLVPIGVAVVLAGMVAVRDGEPFLPAGMATTAGVAVGAAVVVAFHLGFGWHTRTIVAVPVALAIGSGAVVVFAALWRRLAVPAWTFPAGGAVVVGGVAVITRLFAPGAWMRVTGQLRRLRADREIVEVQSLFGTTTTGWLLLFGLLLLVAIPYMAWGAYRAYGGDRRWAAAASYGWVLLILATVQSRFAGELSPFVALFAGLGLVHVAERVDAAELPVAFGGERRAVSLPDRRVAVRLAVIVALVCGLSAVMAPISANNIAFGDEQYGTAVAIDDHATDHAREFPDSYVFSPWSWNRMYNYHVNGESQGYNYALNNYRPFSLEEDPDAARDRLRRGTNGEYVVTEPVESDLAPETMHSRLHDRFGSRGGGVDGLSHYRAIHASESGDYKAFRVVPGATVRLDAESNTVVTVETAVDTEGASFTYTRRVTADDTGTAAVTVAYPGEYDIDGADTDTVVVSEDAVTGGRDVDA